jgi:hypothetical protein
MTDTFGGRDPAAYAATLVLRHGRTMAFDVAWKWQKIYGQENPNGTGPSWWSQVITALRHNSGRKPNTKAERRRLREKRKAAQQGAVAP